MAAHNKYSLKRHLLVETTETPAKAFLQELVSLGDEVNLTNQKYQYVDDTQITFKYGECQATLSVDLADRKPNEAYMGYLEVTDTVGDPDPSCYQNGYAAELMQLVVSIADKHKVNLALDAEGVSEEQIDLIYGVDLPNTQELANFYARYGFEETGRNSYQIQMYRSCR